MIEGSWGGAGCHRNRGCLEGCGSRVYDYRVQGLRYPRKVGFDLYFWGGSAANVGT